MLENSAVYSRSFGLVRVCLTGTAWPRQGQSMALLLHVIVGGRTVRPLVAIARYAYRGSPAQYP
jgi:hypothetical protein